MNINELLEVVKKGTLYYPAQDHYLNQTINIQCDRCYRNNLEVCISYNQKDICLPCADILVHKLNYIDNKNDDYNKNIFVKMKQDIFVKMEQDIFIKKSFIIDDMCLTSYPCKHRVITIESKNDPYINKDGVMMDGITIANKYWSFLTDSQKKHFEIYLDKNQKNNNKWNIDFYGR